jgi:hypothetical protein
MIESPVVIDESDVHPDSASMEFHMRVAGPALPRFRKLVTLRSMNVYGRPSPELLGLLRLKAEMLGDAGVVVQRLHEGFGRLGIRESVGDLLDVAGDAARPDDAPTRRTGPETADSLGQ